MNNYPTITRQQFQSAIEAGVTQALAAGLVNFSQAAELRRFGREHVGLVAYEDFRTEVCGCPLAETGLRDFTLDGRKKVDRLSGSAAPFYATYDCRIRTFVGGDDGPIVPSGLGAVVEVIDR